MVLVLGKTNLHHHHAALSMGTNEDPIQLLVQSELLFQITEVVLIVVS